MFTTICDFQLIMFAAWLYFCSAVLCSLVCVSTHVRMAQGKKLVVGEPRKSMSVYLSGGLRISRTLVTKFKNNYIKFSEVTYSVLSICAARKCPDRMQTWGDVKTKDRHFIARVKCSECKSGFKFFSYSLTYNELVFNDKWLSEWYLITLH